MTSQRSFDLPPVLRALMVAMMLLAAACTSSALWSVRRELGQGQYVQAHQKLRQLSSSTDLSSAERREIDDDLCLSEFEIGAPSYPLSEQRRICGQAAAEPDSRSAPVLARLYANDRDAAASEVQLALEAGDLSRAERAALRYADYPGADPALITQWSSRIWSIADQTTGRVCGGRRRLSSTVARLRAHYPEVSLMSPAAFEQWTRQSLASGSAPIITRSEFDGSTIHLWIADEELPTAAFHVDKLAGVNDALAAHCDCAARTRISNASNGLPAYLVYLDTDLRASDVFVLPGAQGTEQLTAQK